MQDSMYENCSALLPHSGKLRGSRVFKKGFEPDLPTTCAANLFGSRCFVVPCSLARVGDYRE